MRLQGSGEALTMPPSLGTKTPEKTYYFHVKSESLAARFEAFSAQKTAIELHSLCYCAAELQQNFYSLSFRWLKYI